jgi:hypothetical protein
LSFLSWRLLWYFQELALKTFMYSTKIRYRIFFKYRVATCLRLATSLSSRYGLVCREALEDPPPM